MEFYEIKFSTYSNFITPIFNLFQFPFYVLMNVLFVMTDLLQMLNLSLRVKSLLELSFC